jgi:DNA invertase Pin-like site-specific DNA recombinase
MNRTTTSPIDIYARVSRKGDKRQRSIEGQVGECKARLAELGLPAGETHRDEGRSAWSPCVRRPGWETQMARLESGAAGGVIVFDLERFTRQPAEGERLITAAERGLLVLDSDAEFDLASASGKKAFRDAMTAAAYYSDRLSDRVTRGKRLKAMAGEPNGRVTREHGPFGFLPDGTTPHPEESEVLRELVRRFLDGEPQDALIADLNARGVLTSYGKPWTRAGLRQVLTRPLNAGLIEYKGAIVGTLPGEAAVISQDDHDRVLVMYAARKRGRPPSPRYLCSGVTVCGLCGKPMSGRPRINMKHYPDGEVRREYWCAPSAYGGCGRIAVDQRALDAHAAELAILVLSDAEQAHASEIAAEEAEAEARGLDDQIARAEELAGQLAERLGRGEITLHRYDKATAPLDRRIARLREQRAALGTGPGRPPAVDTEAAWRKRWAVGTPEERRGWLRQALRGRRLVVSPGRDAAGRVSLG